MQSVFCPNCKGKDIGKIATSQYYCWDCFIEFAVVNGKYDVFQIEEDGSLSSLNDLFEDDDLVHSV
ncbi:hypothetical protein GCM10010965_06760 [Caldalkalibacillus thermarum]|uniref:hypothetical protein n=1 Tax=Caldalkalibacillus thermarum TaxID=296745 RepID=UPI00166F492C|nr:hypothetical protein [Caldalkalibacillus thermarum]GGK16352.1 hypothetical protein GCM10010965_06760 [Caldalkalibacillus thermarum]